MKLVLDHQQRLNLIALCGAQRGNVAEMRQYWGLMDRLELSAQEKEAINYRVATADNGVEVASWDRGLRPPPVEFEISEAEGQRLRKIIEEWPHFLTQVDRLWIEPLLELLPSPGSTPAPVAR